MSYLSLRTKIIEALDPIEGIAEIKTFDDPDSQKYPFVIVKPEIANAGTSEPHTNCHRKQTRRMKVTLLDEKMSELDGEAMETRFITLAGEIEDAIDKMPIIDDYKIFIREGSLLGFAVLPEGAKGRIGEFTIMFKKSLFIK